MINNYINNQFLGSETTFANVNPATGTEICQVAEANEDLVDQAVESARQALSGPWGDLTPAQRAKYLHKIADGIESRFDDFVAAEIADTGKPLAHASTVDIPRGATNFRFFANLLESTSVESYQTNTADGRLRFKLCNTQAARCSGSDFTMEFAAVIVDLEGSTRSGGWKYHRRQAFRRNTLFQLTCWQK